MRATLLPIMSRMDSALSSSLRLLQQPRAGRDRGERIAQIVAEHRDELLAQLRRRARVEQIGLRGREAMSGFEMERDQLGEQLEHADHARVLQLRRPRVDRAQRAVEAAVLQEDRHRDVALEAVHRRRVMLAEHLVLGDVVDHDRVARLAHLVADRGLDLEFAAGLQPERDLVVDRKADPALRRHARDRREAHAGDAAHHVQDCRDRRNRLDRVDIRAEIAVHSDLNQSTRSAPGQFIERGWAARQHFT